MDERMRKSKEDYHKFRMQIDSQWGVGENGERLGSEFKNMEEEKTGKPDEQVIDSGKKIINKKTDKEDGLKTGPVMGVEEGKELVKKMGRRINADKKNVGKSGNNNKERKMEKEGSDFHAQSAEEAKKERIENFETEIKRVDNFEQLFDILRKAGEIKGSVKSDGSFMTYNAEEIVGYIDTARNVYRDNKKVLSFDKESMEKHVLLLQITRTDGIRDKVIELLLKDNNADNKNQKEKEKPEIIHDNAEKKDDEKSLKPQPPEELKTIDAEFKDVEGSKEVIKYESNEKEADLEKMQHDLEIARKEYLTADYDKNKAYKRIYKYFGSLGKDKAERSREEDQDLAWYRAHYDHKLFEYKNALLDDARKKGASNQELGEILTKFEVESKINLKDVHAQIKLEKYAGTFSETIRNNSMKMVEYYKKLPLAKKIAIGAAFGLAGVGVGFTGSAIAMGTVATAATMRRVFMGVVSGTSLSMVMETRTKKNTEKNVSKEMEKAMGEMEGLDETEKMALIEEKINKLIIDENYQINTIKNKNLRNILTGVAVGATVGTGAMSYIYRSGLIGFSSVKGYFSGSAAEHTVSGQATGSAAGKVEIPGNKNIPVPPTQETPSGHESVTPEKTPTDIPPESSVKNPQTFGSPEKPLSAMPDEPQSPEITPEGKTSDLPQETLAEKPPISPEVPKGKVLTVDKWEKGKLGGSFEGEIKKYLVEEKGMKKTEAGKMAHRMFMEYQKDHPAPKGFSYHKILPGAQIEISPDGKISGFHDGTGSKWPENVEKNEPGQPAQETPKSGTKIPEDIKEEAPKKEILEKDDGKLKSPDEYQSKEPDAVQPAGPKEIDPKNFREDKLRILEVRAGVPDQSDLIGRLQHQFTGEVKKISFNSIDNWNYIKDEKAVNIITWLKRGDHPDSIKLAEKINEIMGEYKRELGIKSRPERGETVAKWIGRIVREKEKARINLEKYSIAA